MTDESHQRILGIPITDKDPPSYVDSEGTTPSGFPTGYFTIKNLGTGRLLDIARNSVADGTHAVLWPPKENSLVLPMRSPAADNQVFFVDYTGALCSKASGHALDVEGGRLVLRHRKPFTLPFPNPESHPLPRITYSSSSKLLRATFGCDPNYPPPRATDPTNAWRSVDYVVAAVPVQRPLSFLQNTMAMMSTIGATLSKPQALLTNAPTSPAAAAYFALGDDEVMEEDRLGDGDDVDDSPDVGRPVRVLELPIGWLEKAGAKLSDESMRRRQWVVEPLLQRRRSSGS
ncbi:hypothetical protein FRC08_012308 [Ceratobasidium sp. 394]|nr:hypothetical protein FRC08_012308 [Ceratobasidium sp. 394]KAG9078698.1 hypothetical protein FS749_009246 [Ceratobasidium sp. UAMH 11750]